MTSAVLFNPLVLPRRRRGSTAAPAKPAASPLPGESVTPARPTGPTARADAENPPAPTGGGHTPPQGDGGMRGSGGEPPKRRRRPRRKPPQQQLPEGDAPILSPQPGEPDPIKPAGKRNPGRNLPLATIVGMVLLAALFVSLFALPQIFPFMVALTAVIGSIEVATALSHRGMEVPLPPLLLGAVGMVVSTVSWGAEGLVTSAAIAIGVVTIWRVADATGMSALRDVMGAVFTIAWLPLLGCFLLLLHAQPDGAWRALLALLVPVANDTGGYFAGVLFGRTPMAPAISPKKTWEGFAGSLLLGSLAAVLISTLALGGPWWFGLVLGPVIVVVATVGDLCESLLKRDLGLKDMGQLLPGHGGIMDRIDSLLLAAPVTYLLLGVLL
ncbi:phosphatidate cytidylyltransferase [Dermabacteraceae bacterium P13103]